MCSVLNSDKMLVIAYIVGVVVLVVLVSSIITKNDEIWKLVCVQSDFANCCSLCVVETGQNQRCRYSCLMRQMAKCRDKLTCVCVVRVAVMASLVNSSALTRLFDSQFLIWMRRCLSLGITTSI